MLAKLSITHIVFLILYIMASLCSSTLLYASENNENSSHDIEVVSDYNLEHQQAKIPEEWLVDLTKETDEFSLTQYYDDLEPPNQGSLFGRYSVLAEDTAYFAIPGIALLGFIYMLPEGVSKWDKDNLSWNNLGENWTENVTSWEWDQDEAWINYIGHPYFGSAYFIHARHYGYSRMESFCYSFTMSAIYEIVLEAWAEPVSIQDMIFTPLLGWGFAELLLPLEYKIKRNDSEVLNSKILGSVSLFLIDPFGHIILPLKKWSKSLFSEDAEITLKPSIDYHNLVNNQNTSMCTEDHYKLNLTITW